MITIFNKYNVAYFIRPCPLINITWNTNFNQDGQIGGKYDITLTGTLLSHAGSPIYPVTRQADAIVPDPPDAYFGLTYASANDRNQTTQDDRGLGSLLSKQVALRDLFSKDCLKIEVASVEPGQAEPVITFFPKFVSINFAEDIWVEKCNYTITLEAEFLLDKNDNVIGSESYATKTYKPGDQGWPEGQRVHINNLLAYGGGFIEDFQESWSIEPEDGNGNTVDPTTGDNVIKIYRLTRNLSAKGKDISKYKCFGTQPANYYRPHEQAKRYILNHIQNSGIALNHHDDYPSVSPNNLNFYFASGLLNLHSSSYGGYNHARTENIDITQGSYTVQDTWILSSGNAQENYNLSYSYSEDNPRNAISLQGTIKGLTSIPGSGSIFGGNMLPIENTPYENAINKYRAITNNGLFGITAHTYKRVNAAVGGGVTLNPIPYSISLATNEFTGEINYTIEYDDRVGTGDLGSGIIAKNVSVTDTYPGDVFAVIPVIGRPTGPVLQYIGGRTEYQRSLSIELLVQKSTSSNDRQNALRKPSLAGSTRTGLINLINAYSPLNENGIRKYFASPPQETWDPKEGRYTLNINWTYELNN